MKKTYINPEMEVVTIHVKPLMAGSVTSVGLDNNYSNSVATSQADARFDDFDDEEY